MSMLAEVRGVQTGMTGLGGFIADEGSATRGECCHCIVYRGFASKLGGLVWRECVPKGFLT
jgi:hypothetical protein